MMRICHRFGGILGVLLIVGCEPRPQPKPTLYPTTGTITHNGKPVVGGGLIFLSRSKDPNSFVINANIVQGAFTVETTRMNASGTTDTWPGAPVGEYDAVFHPISNGATMGLEVKFEKPVTITAMGPNTLQFSLPDQLPTGRGEERDDNLKPDAGKAKNKDTQPAKE
jgi:hypothetical protein